MNMAELKEQAITYQMAYYISIYSQECLKNEYLSYDHVNNIVTFDNEIDIKRHNLYNHDVFSIPVSELIGCGGLIEIFPYSDNPEESRLHLKDIDAILTVIRWHYGR